MNILYIAYSCDPYAGSEDKIGWNVPLESTTRNNVYVITKEEHRSAIERYLQENPVDNFTVYYVDIPSAYKRAFKGFMYSGRLNVWHKRVYPIAKEVCRKHAIQIIHQVTPVEFRAIGDYGRIENIKFVCGPIGGAELLPRGLKNYSKGHKSIEYIRYLLNVFYKYLYLMNGRLKKCDYIMYVNKETQDFLS